MTIEKVFEGINLFLLIISWVIVAYGIMSWIVRPTNALFQIVSRVAQPFLAIFRPITNKMIKKGLMFDLTPLFALLAINIIRNLMFSLLAWILMKI